MTWRGPWIGVLAALGLLAGIGLAVATWRARMPLPASLPPPGKVLVLQALARDGTPLSRSHQGRYNRVDQRLAWQVPRLLREAFVASEDQHYWQHGGVDWRARFAALWSNLRAGHVVRGASTLGEQVARILKPRPRSYWSHWMAGVDAGRLLRRFGHAQVLTFYLNQVPYAAQRRGVAQASTYYFDRPLDALSPAELLALAVLVRSPQGYDPFRQPAALRRAVNRLALRMRQHGTISAAEGVAIRAAPIAPAHPALAVDAGPFVVYATARAQALGLTARTLHTTLDADLQRFVQQALRTRLGELAPRGVTHSAALVIDNATGAVRAWAVAPAGGAFDIDPVLAPRQPGSTLKPFVYGLALANLGWRADTVIEDAPLTETVHEGVHRYRNYSGRHYGPVSLRYALANSLNIPAIKTAQAVGVPAIMALLHQLGFSSLDRSADYYGPAVVLGDGAVPLFDLVQAYSTLARRGEWLPLRVLADAPVPPPVRVLPAAVTALLANILSDPDARAAEFGRDSVLDLPWPTAVKTGTSSDYRDIWTVGFDNRYTVGIWMGRLGGGSTDRLTGSTGPALVLRQIFAHLRADTPYAGLWRSPQLVPEQACEWIGGQACFTRSEWRLAGNAAPPTSARAIAFARPLSGETIAIDPRVPRVDQRYRFALDTAGHDVRQVDWTLDGEPLESTTGTENTWAVQPGSHRIAARVWLRSSDRFVSVPSVAFTVLAASLEKPPISHR